MSHKDRDYVPGRWRRVKLDLRGEEALMAIEPVEKYELLIRVHQDTEALRRFGELLKELRALERDSKIYFELEPLTGKVALKLFDAETGELQFKLTPEEVAKGLKTLEETDDNAAPLSSFFVNVSI